jgi:hypothetical protein
MSTSNDSIVDPHGDVPRPRSIPKRGVDRQISRRLFDANDPDDRNYAVLAGVVSSRWCPPRKAGGRPATHSQRRIVGWDRKVPARSSNRCVGLVDKSPLGHPHTPL